MAPVSFAFGCVEDTGVSDKGQNICGCEGAFLHLFHEELHFLGPSGKVAGRHHSIAAGYSEPLYWANDLGKGAQGVPRVSQEGSKQSQGSQL